MGINCAREMCGFEHDMTWFILLIIGHMKALTGKKFRVGGSAVFYNIDTEHSSYNSQQSILTTKIYLLLKKILRGSLRNPRPTTPVTDVR